MRKGVQGAGSSPTLFMTLVERLLWRKWDRLEAANEWAFPLAPVTSGVCPGPTTVLSRSGRPNYAACS